jgi:hypothetical protein
MDSEEPKTLRSGDERVLHSVLEDWVCLGKVLGFIVIVIGSIASAIEAENRLLGAVVGFALYSFAVALLQSVLLGLPRGLLGGAPLGAVVGTVVVFFKPSILDEFRMSLMSDPRTNPGDLDALQTYLFPQGLPNQLLTGAVLGAFAGAVIVSGMRAHDLIEDGVTWWPLAVYKRAIVRCWKFVMREVLPPRPDSKSED